MNTWITILVIISCLAVTGVPQAVGYFGLTSRESLSSLALSSDDLLSHHGTSSSLSQVTRKKICDLLKLNGRQKKMCQKEKGTAETLLTAVKISVEECQRQFSTERWNCSLGAFRLNLIEQGYKETSFLYAISSASLVHSFARACSRERLDKCSCDELMEATRSKQPWMWGGCGDNVKYSLKFTRRFLKSRGSSNDLRGQVDLHNSRLGMKMVKDGLQTKCKCHGVSGSCAAKTCWRQLLPFPEIGSDLKSLYEKALKVAIATNGATGRNTELVPVVTDPNMKTRTLKPTQVVYLEDSPSFCQAGRYSRGTKGRVCNKGANCDAMCCGRGYNVQTRIVNKRCHCKVIWCCKVQCKSCPELEERYLCK